MDNTQQIPPTLSPSPQPQAAPPIRIRKDVLKIVGAIVLVCIVIVLSIVAYTHHEKASAAKIASLTAEAEKLLTEGKFQDAANRAKDGLAIQAKNKALLITELQALGAQGNRTGTGKNALDTAKPYIQEALHDYPTDPNVLEATGYLYEVAGQYQTALSYYNKALTEDPNSAKLYFHQGHVYEFLNEQDKAFADYDKAYSLDSSDPLVLVAKGREAVKQENMSQAATYFQQAAQAPTVTYTVKAEALTGASQAMQSDIFNIRKTTDLAHQATIADPSYAPGLAQYGFEVLFTGNTTDSLSYINKAISIDPSIAANYWMKAFPLRDDKRFAEAINSLQTGLDKIDSDMTLVSTRDKNTLRAQILYELAVTSLMGKTGNSSQILQWLSESLQLNPNKRTDMNADYQANFYAPLASDQAYQGFIARLQ